MSAPTATTATTPAIPIILWCVPRSASTATERAFMQRSDTRCYHEMLGDPFYYSASRACRRYDDAHCKATEHWQTSVVQVLESLAEGGSGVEDGKSDVKYIFSKEMAQYAFSSDALHRLHPSSRLFTASTTSAASSSSSFSDTASAWSGDVLENPTQVPTALLRRFRHAFLVRTPEKSVPSYFKCVQSNASGFDFFDAAEAGYKELLMLYKWMANPASDFHHAATDGEQAQAASAGLSSPPPLVDATTLLSDPERVVEQLCVALGMPFEKRMLSWDSGKVDAFSKWDGYHDAAEQSTGFRRPSATATNEAKAEATTNGDHKQATEAAANAVKPKPALPKDVQQAIDENLPVYRELLKLATIK